MTPDRYEGCSIYVRGADDQAVRDLLIPAIGGEVSGRTLDLPGLVMDVRTNPDVDPNIGDNFLFWPVLIEVESSAPHDREPILGVTTRVLTTLWDAGHPAVAACDFEDELPWQGGITRARAEGHDTHQSDAQGT
jgi:hypothetical protein